MPLLDICLIACAVLAGIVCLTIFGGFAIFWWITFIEDLEDEGRQSDI